MVYGQSALAAGEMNDDLLNARHEGGPRNGVLTAIEDFMDSTRRDLEFLAVPGPSGLGLLIDGATLERRPAICEVVKRVHDTAFAVAISPRYASRYFCTDLNLPPVQDIRLTKVDEADALPLRDSLADLLAPDASIGRLELLPGSSRPVRDWYARALPIAGGTYPWWSDEPVLTSDPLFLFRVPDAYYMPRFGAVISSDGQVFGTSVAHALYHTPDMALLPEVSVDAGLPYLSRKRVDAPWLGMSRCHASVGGGEQLRPFPLRLPVGSCCRDGAFQSFTDTSLSSPSSIRGRSDISIFSALMTASSSTAICTASVMWFSAAP